MPTETPEKALENLFRDLFTVEQLRRVLRGLPGGETLVDELPGAPASSAEVIHQAVSELKRAGMVDQELFDALATERPKKAERIREVARAWAVDLGEAKGSTWRAKSSSTASPAPLSGGQHVHNHGTVGEQFNIQGGSHVFNLGKGNG